MNVPVVQEIWTAVGPISSTDDVCWARQTPVDAETAPATDEAAATTATLAGARAYHHRDAAVETVLPAKDGTL